jgi:hypothetical protein
VFWVGTDSQKEIRSGGLGHSLRICAGWYVGGGGLYIKIRFLVNKSTNGAFGLVVEHHIPRMCEPPRSDSRKLSIYNPPFFLQFFLCILFYSSRHVKITWKSLGSAASDR